MVLEISETAKNVKMISQVKQLGTAIIPFSTPELFYSILRGQEREPQIWGQESRYPR